MNPTAPQPTAAQHPAPRPITSVLVANRGEIARRVFASCRRRGISTVAVFSDADADSPHVSEADAAVRLPGNSPGETYLRGDLVIAAALRAGADAIHPGYGFLSESADFAEQVMAAGLTWIGPDPDAIRVMGSKVESKQRMADAGVPVLDRLDPDEVSEDHLPVLVKASAGGGGRGMRIVRTLGEVADAVTSASREAASAFGDPTVFVERYLGPGTTSRSRSWPMPTARCGPSASASARSSGVTRRSSRRHPLPSSNGSDRRCASDCSPQAGTRRRPSATGARARSSSSPCRTGPSPSSR